MSQRCRVELIELTVDNVWQIADAGDRELQRLARNIRRGNLELGAEDSDGHELQFNKVNKVMYVVNHNY